MLQNLNILKPFKRFIDAIIINNEYKFFTNKIQIQIHPSFHFLFSAILCNSLFLKFSQLIDIVAIDRLKAKNRFSIIYVFLSVRYSTRIFLSFFNDGIHNVLSLSTFFNSSTWLEREVFDMFGIFFFGNTDLRRILTDYGFEGYPLRKDFPVFGFTEKYFSIAENTICTTNVSFLQEFRFEQKK